MADVTNRKKPTFLRAEFNEFLFALIGADENGTYLTVVSALARLDLDPWAEAASLNRLPEAIATQRVAELMSQFPEILAVRVDAAMVAARLIALLPVRSGDKSSTPGAGQNLQPKAEALVPPRFIFALLFLMITVLFGTQMVAARFPEPQKSITATAVAIPAVRTAHLDRVSVKKDEN